MLLGDRRFTPYAVSFSLSFAAMFAYISARRSFEDIYGISPQLFSVVFAVNSVGLIRECHSSAHSVGRVGAVRLLRRGLVGTAVASVATLLVTVTHAGLAALLVCFFVPCPRTGFVLPNGAASAMAEQQAPSVRALLGLGQSGGAIGPLVGVGGSHDALARAIGSARRDGGAPDFVIFAARAHRAPGGQPPGLIRTPARRRRRGRSAPAPRPALRRARNS